MLLILSISFTSAFGVTAPYWDDHPLEISAGQSTNVQLELQNMVGDRNLTVQGSVVQGGNIVSITDKDAKYSVPFGSKVKVNTKVSIPNDAKVGEVYTVGLSFTTLADPSQGLGLGSSIDKYYPIKVIEKAPVQQKSSVKVSSNMIYIVAGIIILLIIIFLLFKRKNKKR